MVSQMDTYSNDLGGSNLRPSKSPKPMPTAPSSRRSTRSQDTVSLSMAHFPGGPFLCPLLSLSLTGRPEGQRPSHNPRDSGVSGDKVKVSLKVQGTMSQLNIDGEKLLRFQYERTTKVLFKKF